MDDTPRPPCPKCKSESVYRVIIDVIIEHVGKQRWHCATCKYEWPASEKDEQLDPSR
jgi:transposase-like protein